MNHPRHALQRVSVPLLIAAAALMLLDPIFSDLQIDNWGAALGMAALVGLLNALVWPLFVRFALPITVLTLGLAALLLNGVLVLAAGDLNAGVTVSGIGTAVGIALALTLIHTVV